MWLLNISTRVLESFQGVEIPPYAILSHRWEEDEPTFKDVQKQLCGERKGYKKVYLCCKQASLHGYHYVWVDTCCIDKRSSAELSEAINSMYRYYANAAICYVYLSDILSESDDWAESQWFKRGWTLQELLASEKADFYDSEWTYLGDKVSSSTKICSATQIPSAALEDFHPDEFPIAERMAWASERVVTRPEDRAYSLLGIFDVNMPLLYGEGAEKAFYRLQEEIMKTSADPSIFAWTRSPSLAFGMLAESPDSFSLPWSVRANRDPREKKYLRPFISDYTHSKAGISGTFSLRQHAFNVYVADVSDLVSSNPDELGELTSSSSKLLSHVGIFLQYFPSDNQFHRVQFDGVCYVELNADTYSRTYCNTRKILISRCRVRAESSRALSIYACRKLSLSLTPRSMFSIGFLKLKAESPPSNRSQLFVPNMGSSSFVASPCIVLENKLYLHFGYNLWKQLVVFVSSFEGNMVAFMMNREKLFSPSPPASIERLESSTPINGVHRVESLTDYFPRGIGPQQISSRYESSIEEVLRARKARLGDSCQFVFCPTDHGSRILLSFHQTDEEEDMFIPIPDGWLVSPLLSRRLWSAG